jgi:hypothetical protein
MTPYTYGSLYADLQSWNEDYSADLQAALPRLIQNGELAMLRDMDLDCMDFSVATDAIDQTTGIVAKPTNMIRDRVLVLQDATPATVGVLVKRTYDYVTEYNAANGAATGPPKYYSEYDLGDWVFAPVPDQAYTVLVRGIYPTPLIGDNSEDNAPAAIAAAQNTTSDTALTLTASPYVPTGEPVYISLTSSGDMSANPFTVVGLDVDGNALTEDIPGPNDGYVTTSNAFSSITSITPGLTDGVNTVSAGTYSNNTSWMSTRFPDVLFAACMIEVTLYLKRFSAMQVAKNEYNEKLQDALQQTRTMQRSDADDLFAARQLINGPPKQAIAPPAVGSAQQQPTG